MLAVDVMRFIHIAVRDWATRTGRAGVERFQRSIINEPFYPGFARWGSRTLAGRTHLNLQENYYNPRIDSKYFSFHAICSRFAWRPPLCFLS